MKAWITKTLCLGKRRIEYVFDIEADVKLDRESDSYDVGEYDLQIMRGSKVIKGKKAEIIIKRFYNECDLSAIDMLLIENVY